MRGESVLGGPARLFGVVAAILAGAPAFGAEVYLVAGPVTKPLPGGATVQMWGFAGAEPDFTSVGAATVPGPAIVLPPGETGLTIHLRNDLTVPVSIVIPGQRALSPVHKFTDPQGRERIDSFAALTAPGAIGLYTFETLRPGTFLYHSGTHPALQLPMGLYGALKLDATPGNAYPLIPYDNDALVVYSEIDPALNQAVQDGTYGTSAYPSTINYRPRYFLLNGEPYPLGAPVLAHPLTVNERTLFRFVNAGLGVHVPSFQGLYVTAVAEDGNLYRYPKEQYSVPLAPGKTSDALLVPAAPGTHALYDARFFLTNADGSAGGMLTRLQVVAPGGAPVSADDAYSLAEDTGLSIASPGVLSNDTGASPTAQLMSGVSNGVLALNADGSFTYAPNANFAGTDLFTYRALDGLVAGNVATVQLTVTPVNDPPAVADDLAATTEGAPVVIPVLANDLDVDFDVLTIAGFSQPAHGLVTLNADQTLTYQPTAGYLGPDAFSYTANDGTADSPMATVTVTVNPRDNTPPLAADDFASTLRNTPVLIDVAANDADPDGTLVLSTVVVLTAPSRGGTLVNHLNGTVTYTPKRNFRGTEVFTYAVRDNDGALSNAATVSVNVVRSP